MCHVYHYQNKHINRVEYLASYDNSSKGIELDFVLSNNSSAVIRNVNRVIQSVKPLPAKEEGGTLPWISGMDVGSQPPVVELMQLAELG